MSTFTLSAAERKQAFLDQFVCDTTRGYASALYDLEAASIEKHDRKIFERVLDIVDIYDEIDESELAKMRIQKLAKSEQVAA